MRRTPLGLRVAARLLPAEVRDEVLRELLEQHARHRDVRGRLAAWRWTWRQPWAAWLARDARDAGRGGIGRGLLSDLAQSQRTLRRRPALASTLVATIAVSVGAVAAIAGIEDRTDSGRISEHSAGSQTPAAAVAPSHPRFLL
jgi:hypothetical protein